MLHDVSTVIRYLSVLMSRKLIRYDIIMRLGGSSPSLVYRCILALLFAKSRYRKLHLCYAHQLTRYIIIVLLTVLV